MREAKGPLKINSEKKIASGARAFVNPLNRLHKHITKETGNSLQRLKLQQIADIYHAWDGKCAMCGIPLNVKEHRGINALHLLPYIPLHIKGIIELNNIVPTCRRHYEAGTAKRYLRQDIPDLNTVADLIELILQGTILKNKYREEKSSNFFPMEEKVYRLKQLLNLRMEEFATCLQYKPFKDWHPDNYEMLEDGKNTIGDLVEKIVDKPEAKEEIVERLKQLATTKQYNIVRKK